MNRRQFMSNRACAALALRASAVLGNARPTTTLRVGSGPPLAHISPDFLGLGYEISSVARPSLFNPVGSVYVQWVRTLGVHGVVRVGGDTADYARYNATAKPVSSPFGTVVNDAVLQGLGVHFAKQFLIPYYG